MLVDNKIIKTHINNFYAIEYEEFPTEIAELSMLLMKHQLDLEVSSHFGFNIIGFPIKENASIVIDNSLRIDWMRLVAGRLGDGYRYSNTIVYNNFIWPDASDEDKEKIIKTASKILEVREKYSDWTFAEMYDPLIMPLDLRKAHEENDKAVEKAYGRTFNDSSERIEFLLQKYSEI